MQDSSEEAAKSGGRARTSSSSEGKDDVPKSWTTEAQAMLDAPSTESLSRLMLLLLEKEKISQQSGLAEKIAKKFVADENKIQLLITSIASFSDSERLMCVRFLAQLIEIGTSSQLLCDEGLVSNAGILLLESSHDVALHFCVLFVALLRKRVNLAEEDLELAFSSLTEKIQLLDKEGETALRMINFVRAWRILIEKKPEIHQMFLVEKRMEILGRILARDAVDLKVGALKIFAMLCRTSELRKEISRHWSIIKSQLASGSAEIQAYALRVLATLYKKGDTGARKATEAAAFYIFGRSNSDEVRKQTAKLLYYAIHDNEILEDLRNYDFISPLSFAFACVDCSASTAREVIRFFLKAATDEVCLRMMQVANLSRLMSSLPQSFDEDESLSDMKKKLVKKLISQVSERAQEEASRSPVKSEISSRVRVQFKSRKIKDDIRASAAMNSIVDAINKDRKSPFEGRAQARRGSIFGDDEELLIKSDSGSSEASLGSQKSSSSITSSSTNSSSSFLSFVKDRQRIVNADACHVEKLLDETLGRILALLDVTSMWKAELVCKKWSRIVWTCKTFADLSSCKTQSKLRVLERLAPNNITALKLATTSITRDQVGDSDLRKIGKLLLSFSNITYVNFDLWKGADFGFLSEMLENGIKLETLSVRWCYKLDDNALQSISKCHTLTALYLNGCENISNKGLGYLGNLESLKKLDLSRCNKITDAGLLHLGSLSNLRRLWLVDLYRVTAVGFGSLANLKKLELLSLAECYKMPDDALISSISKLPRLQALDISECNDISDPGIRSLSALPILKFLSIAGCGKISLSAFSDLISASNLQCVDISKCLQLLPLTRLGNLPKLKTLKVIKNH